MFKIIDLPEKPSDASPLLPTKSTAKLANPHDLDNHPTLYALSRNFNVKICAFKYVFSNSPSTDFFCVFTHFVLQN